MLVALKEMEQPHNPFVIYTTHYLHLLEDIRTLQRQHSNTSQKRTSVTRGLFLKLGLRCLLLFLFHQYGNTAARLAMHPTHLRRGQLVLAHHFDCAFLASTAIDCLVNVGEGAVAHFLYELVVL